MDDGEMRDEPRYLPVPPGHLVVTIQVGVIIDEMEARGFENCSLAELDAAIYHIVMLNDHYRPCVFDAELEPA